MTAEVDRDLRPQDRRRGKLQSRRMCSFRAAGSWWGVSGVQGGGVRRIPPAGAGSGRDQADVRRRSSIGDGDDSKAMLTTLELHGEGKWIRDRAPRRRAPKQAAAIALYEGLGYVRIPNYGMYEGKQDCLATKPLSAVESDRRIPIGEKTRASGPSDRARGTPPSTRHMNRQLCALTKP